MTYPIPECRAGAVLTAGEQGGSARPLAISSCRILLSRNADGPGSAGKAGESRARELQSRHAERPAQAPWAGMPQSGVKFSATPLMQ
jgi:hypothetical protein